MTDVAGAPEPRRPGVKSLIPGLVLALLGYGVFWMWVFANAMGHGRVKYEWLLYASGAGFFMSAALFARLGASAASLPRLNRATWFVAVAFVLAAGAVFAGGLIALQPYFGAQTNRPASSSAVP